MEKLKENNIYFAPKLAIQAVFSGDILSLFMQRLLEQLLG